jgi:mono/diheme cytochrome c family protein
MLLGVMATALTMALGYLRASDGGYDELTLTRHRGWGIAAGVLIAVAWGLHRAILKDPAPGGLVAFRTLLFTGFICLSVTGHHGGSLTHGTSLLTENAPQVLRGFLGLSPATGGVPAGGPSVGYATVKGALEKKCYVCHGTEKQKGGLRLDDRALALKGGDSGKPGIAPGDPGRSEIVRACLLPANHDDAMPPEGKEPLTSAELAALIHWIQAGAKY